MLPIHIISLKKDTERRRRAEQQLREQNLAFSIFDALDGHAGAALFDDIDEYKFVLHTGRNVTDGEIGCFASHKALWQLAATQDKPLLIMEDDFDLSPEFSRAVHTAGELIDELGLVRLQDERRGKSVNDMRVGGLQLERYTKTPHCTLCYALSPRVAKRLVALHRNLVAPVDVLMKHVWTFDHPMYCLTPYTVRSNALSMDTSIIGRVNCPKSIATRLRRFFLKANWQGKRLLFNLRQNDARIRALYQADNVKPT